MNILPKKRWHVRTKENIARVRKDEAEAAEKERQEKLRIENADREARLNILKHKSKQKLLEAGIVEPTEQDETPTEHINFFQDLEHAVKTTNKEHDKEIKDKKEDYEKKIGYLTYLGQDTNEALGKKNWYEVPPSLSRSSEIKDTYDKLVLKDQDGKPKQKELDIKNGEVSYKSKQRLDPMNAFIKYCHIKSDVKVSSDHSSKEKEESHMSSFKSKHKKHKKSKDEKKEKLLKLREARLKREREEKCKTDLFLTRLSGEPEQSNAEVPQTTVKPKYNSQFNPELARQNYR